MNLLHRTFIIVVKWTITEKREELTGKLDAQRQHHLHAFHVDCVSSLQQEATSSERPVPSRFV